MTTNAQPVRQMPFHDAPTDSRESVAGHEMHHAALRVADAVARQGDVAGASRILSRALERSDGPSPEGRTLLLQALIPYLVTASRHDEALRRAHELAAHVRIPQQPVFWADLLLPLVRLGRGIRPGGVLARLLFWVLSAGELQNGATMATVRAVQLAMFWQRTCTCRRLSLIQLALSCSDAEVRQALAWIGYTFAFSGRTSGLSVLRRAIALGHRARDERVIVESYPLLAIAYQMCGEMRRALHYHQLFQRRYGSKNTFYRLLSMTNTMVALFSIGDFAALSSQIEACFSQSFALDASRHHLHIYGARAVLLAVEGRGDEAFKALASAHRAAEQSANTLDWMIFCRLSALSALLAGSWKDAARAAETGLAYCKHHGNPRWYRRELREIHAIARHPEAVTPYRARLLEASTRYLADQVRKQHEQTVEGKLSQLADQLDAALCSHFDFDPLRPPTREHLCAKLARTFKTEYVVFASDIAGLKAKVLHEREIERLSLTAESRAELRFMCPDGQFFLGLSCNKTAEFQEDLAVGILLGRLDALSESLVKAAFRLVLSQYVFVHSIRIARDIQARQQRAAAVGMLAQMLAHDVRRPFQMIRAAIEVLKGVSQPDDFRRQAALVLPEVQLATDSAEGLIADVMQIGAGSPDARREAVAPEALIGAALVETFRSYPTAKIRFDYDLRHTGAVSVEPKQMQRVLSNILSNAVQAMSHSGRIAFTTGQRVENAKAQVEFVIANDGPPIAESDLTNLFEPFFTRNKPNGTGLGLAIARGIVEAHGGTIGCTSSPGRGVALHFTLPAVPEKIPDTRPLPASSCELTTRMAACVLAASPALSASAEPDAARLPHVAIVDDSRAFLMGWQMALAGSAEAHCFPSPEAFWAKLDGDPTLLERLVAVVTDYRFTNSRQTGVSFARALKAQRPELPVVISSSGYLSRREIAGAIDGSIDKEKLSWSALSQALDQIARQREEELAS